MVEPDMRALGMMQALASMRATGQGHPAGPRRDLISEESALEAVLQIFASVDELLQAGEIDQRRGLHLMTMLMALREYVRPLPDPPGDEELLAADLGRVAQLLTKAARQWPES